jgi:hypothetical protein
MARAPVEVLVSQVEEAAVDAIGRFGDSKSPQRELGPALVPCTGQACASGLGARAEHGFLARKA